MVDKNGWATVEVEEEQKATHTRAYIAGKDQTATLSACVWVGHKSSLR